MSCERRVEVLSIGADTVTVRPVAAMLCEHCQASGRCRADWLNGFSSTRCFDISMSAPISVNIGDEVSVEIDESQLTLNVIRLYGAPLLGLLVGAVGVSALGVSDGWGLVVVSTTTASGVWAARFWPMKLELKVKQ